MVVFDDHAHDGGAAGVGECGEGGPRDRSATARNGAGVSAGMVENPAAGTDSVGCGYVVQQNLNNTLSVIQGNWKYIEPSDKPAIEFWTKTELGNDPKPQLYDLTTDPAEKNNVAVAHPERVTALSQLLERIKAGELQKGRE